MTTKEPYLSGVTLLVAARKVTSNDTRPATSSLPPSRSQRRAGRWSTDKVPGQREAGGDEVRGTHPELHAGSVGRERCSVIRKRGGSGTRPRSSQVRGDVSVRTRGSRTPPPGLFHTSWVSGRARPAAGPEGRSPRQAPQGSARARRSRPATRTRNANSVPRSRSLTAGRETRLSARVTAVLCCV